LLQSRTDLRGFLIKKYNHSILLGEKILELKC
jgi:hypothetical protein